MKKMIMFSAILTTLCTTQISIAAPQASTIFLGGGTIAPTQTLNIPLKLVANIAYTLSCNINQPNYMNNKVIIRVAGSDTSITIGYIKLNETEASAYQNLQAPLSKANNSLQIDTVAISNPKTASLSITNADQDDTVTVTSCSATAKSKN